ncbi:MAG: TRAP transporter small permease [Desulfobulbaceae bacterium]|nr:MAG: TRAP transporter small permease [Desulfobulbaceae bacterium]
MTEAKSEHKRSIFDKFLDCISYVNSVITGIALVFLTVSFGWLVFGRYVLNNTPTWVEQVALLLVVYIAFLGASTGVHRKTHLGVSVFRELSPRPVQRLFELMTYLIMAGFSLVMAYYGYKLTLFKWDALIPLINVTEGLRSLPIMLSGIFIFLFSIGHLIHFFTDANQNDQD